MSDPQAPPKKTVLLVDVHPGSREERSCAMRELGAAVDCAANAAVAVSLCQSSSYNLVLVDMGHDVTAAERLAEQIKTDNPRQRVAFLVGSPLYVASSLQRNGSKRPGVPVKVEPSMATAGTGAASLDFGQRVRKAEADAEAEAEAKHNSAEEV
jgi:CheY-like chemotaxis protein